MPATRPYDLVLFGATGFTGQLTAQYLAMHGGKRMRWALAGRNRSKLEALAEGLMRLSADVQPPAILLADSGDAVAVSNIARKARVVISTVGPYIRHGEPLVAACAAAGTDYVDLTGEPEFVDRMWLRHHATAQASGARIVHCCGFDSIPHDLGVLFTLQHLPSDQPIRIDAMVRAGGEISGGTWHSAITAFSRLRQVAVASRERRRREPRPHGRRVRSILHRVHRDPHTGGWRVPFPSIDPQVVRRSAEADARYGPDFRYGHYIEVARLRTVAALLGGASLALIGSQFGPTRRRLLQWRAQGDGPSVEKRAKAWFKVRFVGRSGDREVIGEVSGGDPGYGETAKMLAESALCLARDRLPRKAGMLTPATAMGMSLVRRLQKAGIRFEIRTGGN